MKRTPVAHVVFPRPSALRPVAELAWQAARALVDTEDLEVSVLIPVPARALRPAQSAARRRRGAPPWPSNLETRLLALRPRPTLVPYVPVPRRSVESATAAVAAALVARPRASRPRLVQGSLLDEGGYAATRIAHAVGARSIVAAHGSDVSAALREISDSGRTRRARAALTAADRVLAMSHEMAQRLVRAGRRARVVPFFASSERFALAEVPRTNPEILFVGRLGPDKGLDVLLEAFARLRHPRATLRLVGRPSKRFDVAEHVARLGLAERVRHHGEAPYADLPSLYGAARVTVVPSRMQHVSGALVESLLVGRPVVTTRVCGVSEVVRSSEGEVLLSLNPENLAMAIDRVLAKADAGAFPPRALRRAATPLAWESTSPRLLEVTRSLLHAEPASPASTQRGPLLLAR